MQIGTQKDVAVRSMDDAEERVRQVLRWGGLSRAGAAGATALARAPQEAAPETTA